MDFDEWIAKLRDRMWASAPGARGRWDAYVAYVHETNISPEIKRDSLEHTEVNLTAAWLKALVPPKMRKSPLMITHGGNIEFVRVLVGRDLLDLSKVGGATGWAVNDGPVRQRLDEETAAQLSITIGTLVTDRALMPPPTVSASPMTTGVEIDGDVDGVSWKNVNACLAVLCAAFYVGNNVPSITAEDRHELMSGEIWLWSVTETLHASFVISWAILAGRIWYAKENCQAAITAMIKGATWAPRTFSRLSQRQKLTVGVVVAVLGYHSWNDVAEHLLKVMEWGTAAASTGVAAVYEHETLKSELPQQGAGAKEAALILQDDSEATGWWQTAMTVKTIADPLGAPQAVFCVMSGMAALINKVYFGGMAGDIYFDRNILFANAGFALAGFLLDDTAVALAESSNVLKLPGPNTALSDVNFVKAVVVPDVFSLEMGAALRWVKVQFNKALSAARDTVRMLWTKLKDTCARWTIGLFGERIGNKLIALFNSGIEYGASIAKTIKDGISKVLGDLYNGWRDFFQWVADMMGNAYTKLERIYTDLTNFDVKKVTEGIGKLILSGMNTLSDWLTEMAKNKELADANVKVNVPETDKPRAKIPSIPTWSAAGLWKNFSTFFVANATVPEASEPLQYELTVDYFLAHPHGTEWVHQDRLRTIIRKPINFALSGFVAHGWIAVNPAWTKWCEKQDNNPKHAHVYDPVAGRAAAELL